MDELVTPPEQDVETAPAEAAPDEESRREEPAASSPDAEPSLDAETTPLDPAPEAAPAEDSQEEPAAPPTEDSEEAPAVQAPELPPEPPADEAVPPAETGETPQDQPAVSMDELLGVEPSAADGTPGEVPAEVSQEEIQLRAALEAIIYVAEEPVTPAQVAAALQQPVERIREALAQLAEEFEKPEHGIGVREVAGGYKMATKAEHHETVRSFVKSLKPPLKLSLPALETLAVIAYKQPVTAPEIMEIRGVQGAGVLKTLLDRKLIATAGRKNVIGKPILYRTTKEFLIQFGLKDLAELPSLKEFEEIRRLALADGEMPPADAPAATEPPPAAQESEPEPPTEDGSQPEPEQAEGPTTDDQPEAGPPAPEKAD